MVNTNLTNVVQIPMQCITYERQTNTHCAMVTLKGGKCLLQSVAENSLFPSRLNVQCYLR